MSSKIFRSPSVGAPPKMAFSCERAFSLIRVSSSVDAVTPSDSFTPGMLRATERRAPAPKPSYAKGLSSIARCRVKSALLLALTTSSASNSSFCSWGLRFLPLPSPAKAFTRAWYSGVPGTRPSSTASLPAGDAGPALGSEPAGGAIYVSFFKRAS